VTNCSWMSFHWAMGQGLRNSQPDAQHAQQAGWLQTSQAWPT
jgi:hypothetical protein